MLSLYSHLVVNYQFSPDLIQVMASYHQRNGVQYAQSTVNSDISKTDIICRMFLILDKYSARRQIGETTNKKMDLDPRLDYR